MRRIASTTNISWRPRPAAKLKGVMHDKNSMMIGDWTARHNRWSDLEADQISGDESGGSGTLQARFFGDARERTRYLKRLYYRLPIASRALSYFIYRYFFRLGGTGWEAGILFCLFSGVVVSNARRRKVARTTGKMTGVDAAASRLFEADGPITN